MHLSGSISWNRIHGRRKGARVLHCQGRKPSDREGKLPSDPGEEFIKVGMQIFFLQKRRLVQQSTLQDEILNMRPLF